MAGKIQLKLKKKEDAPAAPAAAPAAGAAPAFSMPQSGGSGGITLELRGATVHVAEVIIRKK